MRKLIAVPNPDLKGRIIGREGRNIRTLESTGVSVIIDESSFITLESDDPEALEIVFRFLKSLDLKLNPKLNPKLIESALSKKDWLYHGFVAWHNLFPYVIIDECNNQLLRAKTEEDLEFYWNKLDPGTVWTDNVMFQGIRLFDHMRVATMKDSNSLKDTIFLLDPRLQDQFPEILIKTTATYELQFLMTLGRSI